MSPKMDSERKAMGDKPYRSILGTIMWGQLATCPDLSFSVSLLACFQANPGIKHWSALMHVIVSDSRCVVNNQYELIVNL